MSEFDKILMQNANMTLGIINLIEILDKDIKNIKVEGKNRDTYLYIRLYEQIKKYLEEVLELSYGKSFKDRKKFYE